MSFSEVASYRMYLYLLVSISTACSRSEFRCASGQCRRSRERCNGRCDCHDCSDEYNCGKITA